MAKRTGLPAASEAVASSSGSAEMRLIFFGKPSAQDEHELGDAGDVDALLAIEAEAALLQDADRADVVLGHVRVEGTLGHEVQESGERPGRDTLAPMLLADPVADEADTVLEPAPDVARDLAVDEDRLLDQRRVAEDLCPVGVEGCAVAGGEGGHARGVGVELLLVEDGEVVGLDVAESYFVAHFSTPRPGLREPQVSETHRLRKATPDVGRLSIRTENPPEGGGEGHRCSSTPSAVLFRDATPSVFRQRHIGRLLRSS